jgi:hypothetical protein
MGFIVTNLETDSRAVERFYNKRGTKEQWDALKRRGFPVLDFPNWATTAPC